MSVGPSISPSVSLSSVSFSELVLGVICVVFSIWPYLIGWGYNDGSMNWWIYWSTRWLMDSSIDWCRSWLIDWCINWSVYWLDNQLIHWFTDISAHRLIDYIEWLLDFTSLDIVLLLWFRLIGLVIEWFHWTFEETCSGVVFELLLCCE